MLDKLQYKQKRETATSYQHNLSEQKYQISPEQAIARDIAEHYIKIQENTQYLTNIIRHQQGKVFKLFHLDISNIELKSFFNLIVQCSYLLYTCYVKKQNLYFSKNLYVGFLRDGFLQIICQFILEQECRNFSQNKKKDIEHNYHYFNPTKYENSYAENTLTLIKNHLSVIKQYIKKQKQRKINLDRNHLRQFETLENATALLSSILSKGIKPKMLISCLQETQIFRTYSYLLKTLNCSLYQMIRKSGNFQHILQQIKNKQLILRDKCNNLSQQQHNIHSQLLQNSLQDFLKYLKSINIINLQISNPSPSSTQPKQRHQSKQSPQQSSKTTNRSYNYKIVYYQKKIKDFNQKFFLQLTEAKNNCCFSGDNQKKNQLFFNVDLIPKTNLITIQYLSNIEANIQNIDALTYHCNNLMMQINNIKVEEAERQLCKTKKKQKLLSFKIISQFNPKQNPFINLMLLIDKIMIYGKVCQPQIGRKNIRIQDHSRFNSVSKKINHLTNLFIKKIRKLYESIPSKNNQN